MTTGTLFDGLFDNAAIFPPGNTPMAEAVRGHGGHTAAWYGEYVGPFLCGAERLPELRSLLGDRDEPLPLSLVAPSADLATAVAEVLAEPRIVLRAVEVALPAAEAVTAAGRVEATLTELLPPAVTGYLQVPVTAEFKSIVDRVAAGGHRAKLRTGGLEASAFPTERVVAEFVLACLSRGVPFKLTAGLHHALRHTAPETGFEHHGFLNVITAVHAGINGATSEEIERLLAERHPPAVTSSVRALGEPDRSLVRDAFVSYGTCGITDPITDLCRLGLLTNPSR
ncbi:MULTISPECIES: hypothetical protein [unclassified Crossiella]|uniref:hypothetical protein n=1 Tax=unclassified Crossiella TaxID=2620835 RepID=UPI001FFED873|nr:MULTISPECIES: hypothetical protein [unclassified Crossiella]MCK2244622.1 hypothetical protein [Crossiella sp. S99.2]MCK2258391.1 hypothetical protein [Crossiella sp. S99.1]